MLQMFYYVFEWFSSLVLVFSVVFTCLFSSGLGQEERLPLRHRLALIAAAYGGDPEKFAPGTSWTHGESEDPVWQMSLALARCLAMLQGDNADWNDVHCTDRIWRDLLNLDWKSCCRDSAAPIFGLIFLVNQAAMSRWGRLDACRSDATLQALHNFSNDMFKWSDIDADHGRRATDWDLISRAWNAEVEQVNIGGWVRSQAGDLLSSANRGGAVAAQSILGMCDMHRRAALYTWRVGEKTSISDQNDFLHRTRGLLQAFEQEHRRAKGLRDGNEGTFFAFRVRSPLWALLRRAEVHKYHVPSAVWSRSFFGEVVDAPFGAAPGVLDAGAADGSDSIRMCLSWPDVMVYALEPVSESHRESYNWFARHHECAGRVALYQEGLSDYDGTAVINLMRTPLGDGVAASSLYSQTFDHQRRSWLRFYGPASENGTQRIKVRTLDSWARQRLPIGGRLDFLRLDMEGAEIPVLRASTEVLARAKLLQVETNRDGSYEQSSSTSVRSFQALLEKRNWHLLWASDGIAPFSGGGDAIFVRLYSSTSPLPLE